MTLCQSKNIVMAFSPPVVGCLLKKAYKRGGHGHPRTPPPGYALETDRSVLFSVAGHVVLNNKISFFISLYLPVNERPTALQAHRERNEK